jgi:hypothetical protein
MITGRGEDEYEGTAVVDWLRLAAPMRRVVSICGGAMLLAEGLAQWTKSNHPLATAGNHANALS